jgi:hypothetical protein
LKPKIKKPLKSINCLLGTLKKDKCPMSGVKEGCHPTGPQSYSTERVKGQLDANGFDSLDSTDQFLESRDFQSLLKKTQII